MLNSGKAIKEKHITLLKREPVLKINLEISHYPTGGDCDWYAQKWWGWGSRKWPVEKCAEKCAQDPNCKRFTHGTQNFWGGPGLGCRTSTGRYNNVIVLLLPTDIKQMDGIGGELIIYGVDKCMIRLTLKQVS